MICHRSDGYRLLLSTLEPVFDIVDIIDDDELEEVGATRSAWANHYYIITLLQQENQIMLKLNNNDNKILLNNTTK